MLNEQNSSLLELEAADYFKLNTCQVNLLTRSNQRLECVSDSDDAFTDNKNQCAQKKDGSKVKELTKNIQNRNKQENKTSTLKKQQIKSSEISQAHNAQARLPIKKAHNRYCGQLNDHQPAPLFDGNNIGSNIRASSNSLNVTRKVSPNKQQRQHMSKFGNMTNENHKNISARFSGYQDEAPVLASLPYLANSSTTSTNSLPSISSSPSVSPSLVCPHLSLDDILKKENEYGTKSPHTIGLCTRCRLDPPPNIQSPLSPAFRPSKTYLANQYLPLNSKLVNGNLKRGYSDHQVSKQNKARLKAAQDGNRIGQTRHSSSNLRDDSLDYYLDPKDLQRLQLSPTLRNSVEYIRNNSIEAGRVLKIYQNGKPFDKPLRICISRNEFSNLNHLLDYINSRQMIPSGARYLFHLDGQLVYSVHELKHGSAYFVSGTRNFDLQSSNIVKEQQKREMFRQYQFGANQKQSNNYYISDQEKIVRSNSNIELKRQEIKPALAQKSPKASTTACSINIINDYDSRIPEQRQVKTSVRPEAIVVQEKHPSKLMNCRKSTRAEPAHAQVVSRELPSRPDGGHIPDRFKAETKSTSKSDDNLTIDQLYSDELAGKSVQSLVRAKSEMSAAGSSKRKKNVTFKDTGRGSSPLILAKPAGDSVSAKRLEDKSAIIPNNGQTLGSSPKPTKKLNDTAVQTLPPKTQTDSVIGSLDKNEIGIQVSDSIDGFLIDLPLPVSRRRDGDEKRVTYLKKGRGSQASSRVNVYSKNSSTSNSKNSSPIKSPKRTTKAVISRQLQDKNSRQTTGVGKRKQIVTISERQLSLDEMDKLKDLDHGDHHSESHKIRRVTIKLESLDDSSNKTEESLETIQEIGNNDIIGKTEGKTASVGQDERDTQMIKNDINKMKDDDKLENSEKHWEYPGGRIASATPTERPVSQSEANEAVHARVITPTPSPSMSAQDNNSLSYESGSLITRNESQFDGSFDGDPSSLTPRVKLPVTGVLRNGISLPSKNFKLKWVNGFAINDQYPENSATALGTQNLSDNNNNNNSSPASNRNKLEQRSSDHSLLSPSSSSKQKSDLPQSALVFKPSERFHNWVCYSNKYDELIYPTGKLVVLWCRWTNEQRYYPNHTSNISCISLTSLDDDLIGSAQLADSSENTNSLIHLWSLGSLETLYVIDQDHFKSHRIFSLKVRNTLTDGCQLSVGARDDKRIWLYRLNLKLYNKSEQIIEQQQVGKTKQTKLKQQQQQQVVNKLTVIKSDKALQSNHIPLLVIRMSNAQTNPDLTNKSPKLNKATADEQLNNLILSFGRRHFQVWATSQKQEKLRLLQSEHKSAQFIETVVKANCLARMSPSEYVVGDSAGNINLLTISIASDSKSASLLSLSESSIQKYRIETVCLLLKPTKSLDNEQKNVPNLAPLKLPSITCLTRISGNLFASSDSNCTIKIWRLVRRQESPEESAQNQQEVESDGNEKSAIMRISETKSQSISCSLVNCVTLPSDLGFICSIVLARYNRRMSLVEFYVVSTSNVILFGSIKLDSAQQGGQIEESKSNITAINQLSSFSVVYEGHESSVSNLVADYPSKARQKMPTSPTSSAMNVATEFGDYFTCSLDCKICKWSGRNLIWKSMLPSACASLAVHPVGFALAIGSGDGTVYILDKISGLLISYFPLTPVCINCLAYSRDGMFLAAGCANGSIFILPVYEHGLKYKKVSIFQVSSRQIQTSFS